MNGRAKSYSGRRPERAQTTAGSGMRRTYLGPGEIADMPRRRYITTEAGSDKRLSSVSERASNCYLLSVPHGDHCGRLPGDPFEYVCTVVSGRRYSDDDGQQIVAELTTAGLYIPYQSLNGSPVLCFPAKAWLEHQGRALNADSRPEHPEPPEGIEGILRAGYDIAGERERYHVILSPTRKTAKGRGRTQKSAEDRGRRPKNATSPPPPPPPPPSPSPTPKKGQRPARARARARNAARACSWCNNPTDPDDINLPEPQRLMQVYHDAYRERQTTCPAAGQTKGGKEWGALTRLLDLAGSFAKARDVIRHGVASEDSFVIDQGHTLAVIAMKYQGIAQALDRGETHGTHRRASGRVTPASPESFGEGGPAKF